MEAYLTEKIQKFTNMNKTHTFIQYAFENDPNLKEFKLWRKSFNEILKIKEEEIILKNKQLILKAIFRDELRDVTRVDFFTKFRSIRKSEENMMVFEEIYEGLLTIYYNFLYRMQ